MFLYNCLNFDLKRCITVNAGIYSARLKQLINTIAVYGSVAVTLNQILKTSYNMYCFEESEWKYLPEGQIFVKVLFEISATGE